MRRSVGPGADRRASSKAAVLYARVSSKDQERGGFSIPAQQQLVRAYSVARGFEVLAEFVDVETAGRAGRTGFGEMIRFLARNPACKAVLVEKTDRLYRNLKDWVTIDELGLQVHLVKEGVVLSEDSVSSEKFVHGIKVLMAKNYVDNLSEEARKGLQEKARQGFWPPRAPLGYRNGLRPDGKRGIEPDPVLGPLVTDLFRWCAVDGCALTELTARLRQAIAPLASGWARPPKIQRSQVHAILRNPLYMGEFDWHGQRFRGVHVPLVSRATWDTVQDRLSGRAPRHRTRQHHEFLFCGLVRCGSCAAEGRRFLLVAEIKKAQYVYYRCEECKRRRRAEYVREERLVEAFVRALDRMTDAGERGRLAAAMARAVTESPSTRESAAGAARDVPGQAVGCVERIQRELADLQARLELAYEDRLVGRIDTAFFDRLAAGWRERVAALQQELAQRTDRRAENLETGTSGSRLARTDEALALELRQPSVIFQETVEFAYRRRMLAAVCSNSTWTSGALVVEWRQLLDKAGD